MKINSVVACVVLWCACLFPCQAQEEDEEFRIIPVEKTIGELGTNGINQETILDYYLSRAWMMKTGQERFWFGKKAGDLTKEWIINCLKEE